MTGLRTLRALGYERAFHIHIRKCGGSTVNRAVFRAWGGHEDDWARLALQKRIELAGGRVLGWSSADVVRTGDWDYGFDHTTMSRQRFPSRTFLFCTVRDPVERLSSHYRMLLDWKSGVRSHAAAARELQTFSDDFVRWVMSLSPRHRSSLLWSFDHGLSLRRALRRSSQVHFYRIEEIPLLLDVLDCRTDAIASENVSRTRWHPTPAEQSVIKDRLAAEYEFYTRIVEGRVGRIRPE